MGFSTSPLSNSRRGSSLGIKRSSLATDLLWDLRQIISLSRNVWIWWWLRPHLIISYCWIHQSTQDEMLWWFLYIFSKSLFQFQVWYHPHTDFQKFSGKSGSPAHWVEWMLLKLITLTVLAPTIHLSSNWTYIVPAVSAKPERVVYDSGCQTHRLTVICNFYMYKWLQVELTEWKKCPSSLTLCPVASKVIFCFFKLRTCLK